MKAVHLLINSYLPEDLQSEDRTYTVKELNELLHQVATKYPDQFDDVLRKVSNTGRSASYLQGETITLQDLATPFDKKALFAQMDKEIKSLPKDKDFKKNRREIYQKYNTMMEKLTSENALRNRNNISMSVLSGARGKSAQLKAMITSPGTYSDYKGNPIDVFSRESFAEGITPATFAASSFGTRSSVISTKVSTAKGGDWAKQMAQVAADMVIRKDDCGAHNGLVLDIEDKSLRGRVLARETAGFKPGTLITRDVLAKMRKDKVKDVEARSPLTCGVHNGLCSKCVGRFYNGGKWAKIGQHVGVEASTSTAEPVTQMALCIAGFEYVNRPDGSKIRLRNIEPGQEVCVADSKGHITSAKVLNVFDQGVKTVRTYKFQFVEKPGYPLYKDTHGTVEYVPPVMGYVDVTCTEDHKFLYEGGKVAPIKELYETGKLNGALLMEDQRKAILIEASAPREEHCYDIEVDHPDHLFVLTTGLICSNSAKHTAGMTQAKKTYSGLGVIQQFTQSPEKFKDEGTVATVDGKVEKIEEAPQGGMFVTIKGKKHYILPGHEVEVKEGQELEAGDQLAEGLVDPEDIVKYKGLGEGRKYWAERLGKILEDSGTPSDKRNLEVLARAAIRHVRVTNQDGMGDYLPDDVVDYNALQASYHPNEETTRLVRPKDAVGKYLQEPVLHYTIGTRITPKVAKFIQDHGHDKVQVEDNAPSFIPEMIRLRTASHSNPDWMASMGTSYLTKQLNEAATEGDDTNVKQNADWRPRLAFGEGFGKRIAETGEF